MALDTIKFANLISMLTTMFGQTIPNEIITEIEAKIILMMKDKQSQKVDLKALFDAIVLYRKIEAIKEYRALTGEGLKESKDAIESIMDKMKGPEHQKSTVADIHKF